MYARLFFPTPHSSTGTVPVVSFCWSPNTFFRPILPIPTHTFPIIPKLVSYTTGLTLVPLQKLGFSLCMYGHCAFSAITHTLESSTTTDLAWKKKEGGSQPMPFPLTGCFFGDCLDSSTTDHGSPPNCSREKRRKEELPSSPQTVLLPL